MQRSQIGSLQEKVSARDTELDETRHALQKAAQTALRSEACRSGRSPVAFLRPAG